MRHSANPYGTSSARKNSRTEPRSPRRGTRSASTAVWFSSGAGSAMGFCGRLEERTRENHKSHWARGARSKSTGGNSDGELPPPSDGISPDVRPSSGRIVERISDDSPAEFESGCDGNG
ncbi:MAG: hypothetical protein CM1200mP2_42510 [Planctomycetaceae bacterium]|nr:MAG: hypothetical protein CM1200mP2_42510 [Planctomycetaceae bacterium]